MRLLLTLRSLKSCEYDLRYFNKLQGFVYNLMRGTPYGELHDKRGYKFFCFSNIFPLNIKNGAVGPIKENEIKKLLISSPDGILIKLLKWRVESRAKEDGAVNIGEMRFSVEGASLIESSLKRSCTLVSATPIIIRIPKINYEKYGISSEKDYLFWRPKYKLQRFCEAVGGKPV